MTGQQENNIYTTSGVGQLLHGDFICIGDEIAAENSSPLSVDVVSAVFGFGFSVEVGSNVHLFRECHWTPLRSN